MQEKYENNTKIIDRLSYYIDKQGGSFNKISQKIGVSNSYFSKMVKSRGSLGEDVISKILLYYENINPEWLITGSGPMLRGPEQKQTSEVPGNMRSVPLIPIEAVAGLVGNDSEGVTYEDCDQYVVPEFDRLGVEFVIRVSGSSMYPKYSNGDLLACRRIHDILFFQWGKVYVIDSSQGQLVKRVFEDPKNADYIMLVSDNKEHYPPFSIPKGDIRSLSIVVGVIRVE